MTRSTSSLCFALALALGASTAAQGQTTPDKAQADAKKSVASKAAPKATPAATAKDVMRGAAPAVSGATKAGAPESMRSISPAKDGYSGCHSKDSDA